MFVTAGSVRAPVASEPQSRGIATVIAAFDAGLPQQADGFPAGLPAMGRFPPPGTYLTLQVLLL